MPATAATPLSGDYGSLTITADGAWTYTAANSQSDIQNLKATESLTDTFTVTSADMVTKTTVTITIHGVEDLVTGVTGEVTEDTSEDADGNLVATGTIMIGGNAGQFMTDPVTGTYGSLTIDAAGAWTYKAANSQTDIQDLNPEAELTDKLTVTSADGATTTTVTITINGHDDKPTLTPAKGEVTEDKAVTSGNLVAKGTVGASGGDAGEDKFMPATAATPLSGDYGSLTITADGAWTYTAANSQSDIQNLKATESLTDTFTVTSADMVTKTTVTITIHGVEDLVTGVTGEVTEDTSEDADGNLVATGTIMIGGNAGQFMTDPVTGTYGSLTIDAAGAWTYKAANSQTDIQDLNPEAELTDKLTVTSADGATTTTVTITINGHDDKPTLTPAKGEVTEDKAVTSGNLVAKGTVGASGGDAGEDKFMPATAATPLSGDYGSLTITADGAWTYTAANSQSDIQNLKATESLTDTFTVTSADMVTKTTVTITIHGVEDLVTGVTGEVTEDTSEDADGNLVATGTIMIGGNAGQFMTDPVTGTYGSLTIDAAGAWTYKAANSQTDIQDLNPEAELTDKLTVTSADGATTTTVTITINGHDDKPTLTPAKGEVTEDKAVTSGNLVAKGTVGASGGDAGEDKFMPATAATPLSGDYGSLTITADGAWTYTAANSQSDIQNLKATESLTDTFTVTSADMVTKTTVTITIHGVEDLVTGVTGEVTEDTSEDADGNLVATGTIMIGGNAGQFMTDPVTGTYGSLTIDAAGAWTYKALNKQSEIQDLNPDATLTDTFTVTSADTMTTTTVTITITGADDEPTLTADTGTVTEDTDVDADGNLVATGTVGASGGDDGEDQLLAETFTSSVGSLEIAANGTWTYTAANSQSDIQNLKATESLTDTFTVTGADGATTTTVTITINGVNDAPVAKADAATTKENTVLTVADGTKASDTTIITSIKTVTDDKGDTSTVTTTMTITGNADLLLNDSDPDSDTFTITAVKGYTRETDGTYKEQTKAVAVNDDGSTAATPSTTQTPTLGSSGGTFTLYADGSYTFDPDTDFDNLAIGAVRTTSVVYTVSDGTDTHTATLTVTVTGENDAPVLEADAGTTDEDTILTVADGATATDITVTLTDPDTGETSTMIVPGNADLLLNDMDPDGDLTITRIFGFDDQGQPTMVVAGAAVGGSAGGQFTINADGSWEFDPGTDFDYLKDGETFVTAVPYTVSDGNGEHMGSLEVRVTGADDVPTLTPATATLTEDASVTSGNLVASGTLTTSGGDAGESGFTAAPATAPLTGDYGTLTITADGAWMYKAANSQKAIQDLGVGATLTDTLTVTSADTVTTTSIIITINGANDAPTADADTGATDADTVRTVANDATGTIITNDDDGTTTTINADLLLNDMDRDTGDELTITQVDGDTSSVGKATDGTNGGSFTIDSKGGWTFNPDGDFDNLAKGETETTSITYTASDGNGGTATATLTVTVTGPNNAPVAENDAGSTTENATLTVADGATGTTINGIINNRDLLLNDSDPDGDPLTITQVDGDTNNVAKATDGSNGGSFTIHTDGSWSFDPGTHFDGLAAGATATTSVTYTASDGTATDTKTLTVTVMGEDDVPTLTPVTASLTEDVGVDGDGNLVASGTVTTTGGDTGEDQFMAETLTGTYGTLTLLADGTWTYTADNSDAKIQGLKATDSPTDTFTVTSSDMVTTTSVTITINGADDTPTLTPSTGSVTEDTAVDDDGNLVATGTVTITGGDTGEDQLMAGSQTGTYGTLTLLADGTWTYTADNSDAKIQGLKATDSPTDTFTVTSADGTATTSITITINGADDKPTLTPSAGTVTEDAVDSGGKNLVTTGTVTISGGDTGDNKLTAATLPGKYGSMLKVSSDGTWTYTADNSNTDIQQLTDTATLTETFTVTGADGDTTTTVTIRINGVDDAQDITGTTTATVTEGMPDAAGNLRSATQTVTFSGGDLNEPLGFQRSNSPDNEPFGASLNLSGLTTPANTATWYFDVANSAPEVQRLNPGETLVLTYSVLLDDGITRIPITVTIVGAESQLSLSSATGGVTEDADLDDDGNLVTTGTITAIDDAKDLATLRYTAETKTGTYGDLTIDAMGAWTYKADNSQQGIQELHQPGAVLRAGDASSRTEAFTVTTADGMTTTSVTITITGADDTPTVAGDFTASVTEDLNPDGVNIIRDRGRVTISGGDSGENEVLGGPSDVLTYIGNMGITPVDGSPGEYEWHFQVVTTDPRVQALRPGEMRVETYAIPFGESTSNRFTVTATIIGADDVPVKGVGEATLIEDADLAELTANGIVTISGGDADEASYVLVTVGSAESTLDADTNTGTATGASGGVLTWQADGTWSYTIDNTLSAIQSLSPSDSLTEVFTFHANDAITEADIAAGNFVDGTTPSAATTTTVTITIRGTDDVPTLTAVTTDPAVTEDSVLTVTGMVQATGGDAGEDRLIEETLTGDYGTLTIAADGTWTYELANNTDAVQGLTGSATLTDTLTVTSADGVTTVDVTITITGTDDVPGLTGSTATLTEDTDLDDNGNLMASGMVQSVGGDADEFGFVTQTLTGDVGELRIGAGGVWTYTADNSQAAIQNLGTGESLTDTFEVTGGDGVTTTEVVITINGLGNDVPDLTGATATLTEDTDLDDNDNLVASGRVSSSGGDTGDAGFTAATLPGDVGTLTIDGEGAWIYTADNSQDAIQNLDTGESLTDTFIVTGGDGVTTTDVVITINGQSNDAPNEVNATLTEDTDLDDNGNLMAGGIITGNVSGAPGFIAETLTGDVGELTIDAEGVWAYTADNSQAAIQDLNTGDSLTDTFIVTSAGGATTITITINGLDDDVPGPTPPDPEPPGPTPPGPTPPDPNQPDPDEPVPVLPDTDTDTATASAPDTAGASDTDDTEADFAPPLPEPRDPDDIFGADDDDELVTIINPIRQDSPLADQEITDSIARYDISNLFRHINIDMRLRFTALLFDGDPLPYFVTFDPTTGVFLFDAAAAAESGVASLQIRVVAIDPDGNRVSDVFRVNFPNTEDGSTDDSADESIDGNADESTDGNADENADAAPQSPEQQNPGPES